MRYLFSFILALQMSLFVCISSYAAGSATASDAVKVASGSEAVKVASGSEASRPSMLYSQLMDSVALYSESDITLLSDSDLPSVTSTVDLSGVPVGFCYKNTSGQDIWMVKYLDSDSHFSFALPSDFNSSFSFEIRLGKSELPPSGKYQVACSFYSDTGGFSYNQGYFYTYKSFNNAKGLTSESRLDVTQSSGDVYISSSIDIGSATGMHIGFATSDLIPPFGGTFNLQFTRLSSSSSTSITAAGGSYSSADAASDTANNTAQIVEKQDEVIDQIVATTETISLQISAFWNQLAGELTNLFNKMNEHHQEDLDKVDEQIENDNQNTREVTGAIEKHGNFIIEGLKSLFIPSDQFFKDYFDDLYDWFSDRFGFLSFPIDLLIRLSDMFINSSEVDCVLTLPSFSVMDQELWPDMSFNFTEFLNENFSFLLTAIRTVSSIGLIMAFVSLCERKWEEVMLN